MTEARLWGGAKLIDMVGAAPQLVLYAVSIVGLGLGLENQIHAPHSATDPMFYLQASLPVCNGLYLSLLMLLLLVRRPPLGSANGLLPKLAALVGFSLTGLLVLLPPARIGWLVSVLSLTLTLGGTIASMYVATILGRSFSVFPQARGLVTSGPYRFVRHPLYLAEFVTVLGISMQFKQPWSLMLALVSMAAQLPRMHYEEEILSTTYPEYPAYMQRTARLIPSLY